MLSACCTSVWIYGMLIQDLHALIHVSVCNHWGRDKDPWCRLTQSNPLALVQKEEGVISALYAAQPFGDHRAGEH